MPLPLGANARKIIQAVRLCALGVLLCLLPLSTTHAAPTPEYELKAALIYKISKFVTWPKDSFSTEDATFGICVLGEDPFGSALNVLEQRQSAGRPIEILRFSRSESVDQRCQIVFIESSRRAFLSSILQRFKGLHLLTVSDISGFAQSGGMLELKQGASRIEFLINHQGTEAAGLEIAAPLLELATIVRAKTE